MGLFDNNKKQGEYTIPQDDGIEEFYNDLPDLPPPSYMLRRKKKEEEETQPYIEEDIALINGDDDPTQDDIDTIYPTTNTDETLLSLDLINDPNPQAPQINKKGLTIFGTVVLLAIIAIITIFLRTDTETNQDATIPNNPTTTPKQQTTPPTNTDETVGAPTNSNNQPGNQTNGTQLIIAYNRAFYETKDANKVFNLTCEENREGKTVQSVQDNLNKKVTKPVNWEATITPKVIGKTYDVKATISDGPNKNEYTQTINTNQKNGKYCLAKITTNK